MKLSIFEMKNILCLLLVFFINIKVLNSFETNSSDDKSDREFTLADQCSPDEIIEKMLDIFSPEDLEEGKQNIKTEFGTFNETIGAIKRFQEDADGY